MHATARKSVCEAKLRQLQASRTSGGKVAARHVANVAATQQLWCNTCGVKATSQRRTDRNWRWSCYAALVVAWAGWPACARQIMPAQAVGASGKAVVQTTTPVDSGTARIALTYVQQRLKRWCGEGEEVAAPVLTGATAVCVTLRLQGETIARAEGDGAESLEAVVTRALASADAKIPAANDALQQQARREMFKRVLAGVEVSGERLPLEAATFAQANSDVKHGLEAIWVEVGETREVIFPQRMMQSGDLPAAAIVSSIALLSGDPAIPMPGVAGQELGDLRRTKGVRVWRGPVVQMVELRAGGPGLLLMRSSRVVELREVNLPMLRQYREQLIDHIASRVARSPDGSQLFATYLPFQDRTDSVASALQRAVLCATLARSGDRGSKLARELLGDVIKFDATSLNEPTTAAACVVTMAWLGSDATLADESWKAALEKARVVIGKSHDGENWVETVLPGSRAMVALAMAELATTFAVDATREVDLSRARSGVRSLLMQATPGALVTHMPWLGYATQRLAGEGEIASAPALREMRAMLWERTIRAESGQADLEGGIVFGTRDARDASGIAGPTWSTARPVAFAAAMLRDERLTDADELYPQLSKLLPSMRFLRQLSIDDASAFACPQPKRAMWGVRVSPWDQRQPIESSAMALLAVSEAVTSIEEMGRRAAKHQLETTDQPKSSPTK